MAKNKHKNAIVLKPHHRKPYRIHHVGFLVFCLLALVITAVELGIILGHDQTPAPTRPVPVVNSATRPVLIKSGYGFSLSVDADKFTLVATDDKAVYSSTKTAELAANSSIKTVSIKPIPGTVEGKQAASVMTIQVSPQKVDGVSAQTARQYFPIADKPDLQTKIISTTSDTINGTPVQKTTYKYVSGQGGTSYGVSWVGVMASRPFEVKIEGLVGSANVPGFYSTILASLHMSANQAVLGASTSIFATQSPVMNGKLDAKYLSDAVSPAVVQIFHSVCGVLTYGGQALGDSACITMTGSGFIATSNGYIATNGHVVVYDAKDALAGLVTSNDTILQAYLSLIGYTPSQIATVKSEPASLAAVISKIYDLKESQLNFASKGELVFVALGKNQPNIKQLSTITTADQLNQFRLDSESIKQAKVIGYNYSAKDKYTAIANPAQGYTASDVALIKINVKNAPTIAIESAPVVQNQKIVLMGFPGDASNPLIDNSQNDVTVTDGVVSAIRQAAGGHAQLYQSDVDASHGNSGGPAVDDQGRAIGLLTYRYVDSQTGNAAKSYIRDIADFTDLARNQAVPINSASKVSELWLAGLQNYSHNHYSAALKDFNQVYAQYPSHRLVGTYIFSSKKAIANGQDIKDAPVKLLLIALGLSLVALASAIAIIIRQHSLHKVYQVSQTDANGQQRAVVLAHHNQPPPTS